MLSIHNIRRIRARATEDPDHNSNWVELHIEGGYATEENLLINLYFSSPELARAFYKGFPDKLTEAELRARATTVWDYPADHPAPGDLGSIPLPTKFFPTLLILLDLAASGVYLYYGDWRRMTYWFAAAVLTATVTF